MDPRSTSATLKPSSTTPPQHIVPAFGTHDDGHAGDRADDLSGPLSSADAPQRHTADNPLCDGDRETPLSETPSEAIDTPAAGRTTPQSRFSFDRQHRRAGLRSHSPAGYESDDSSFLNLEQYASAPVFSAATESHSPFASPDSFPVVRPMKQHSVIVTEGRRYRPVSDDFVPNRSFHPFAGSFELPPAAVGGPAGHDDGRTTDIVRNSSVLVGPSAPSLSRVSTMAGVENGSGRRDNVIKAYLRGDTGDNRDLEVNDPINNYTFFVGAAGSGRGSAETSSASASDEEADAAETHGKNAPYASQGTLSQGSLVDSIGGKRLGAPPNSDASNKSAGRQLSVDEAEKFVETLKRSFAMQRNHTGSQLPTPAARNDANALFGDGRDASLEALKRSVAFGSGGGGAGGKSEGSFAIDEEKIADNYMRQPMHEALRCVSRENLDDDTVSLKAVWESLKSEALSRNILFGFRVTAFAVFPTFLLIEHPRTKDWFAAGSLLPVIAGLFVRPNIGAMMFMVVLALQSAAFFITWGVIMNAVGAVNSLSGWWCGVIFSLFATSMFGELPSKRLLMVYTIIIMQTEHSPGGDALTFPCRFGLDFIIATGFALTAAILPYPIFSYRQANEGIQGLHKLYSAGVGNAMKSFWAPVTMDAKMALSQIPFTKISALTATVRMAIHFTSYEPSEFNLNNTLRGQRLAMLQRIKMHLYAMSAASWQRLSSTHSVHRSQVRHEIKEFEKRMQTPAMELAGEVMKVLAQIGAHIEPQHIAANVSFDAMAEKTVIFCDFIERERLEMLFLRKLPEEETNACLRCFAFHFSLIDIALELQRFEQAMKNFDPSKYPSLFQRALNFFFLDLWHSFWEELPHRFLLDRPYDVRLFKDAIRYTGAFAVACAFTLNYDRSNVYYFGMAILVRLAQQTASETLAIGVNRICGLCIGASLAYITHKKTHNVAELVLLTMTWSFIAMSFSQHQTYGFGAQYVLVTSVAGLRLAPTPALLLTRITDNVFAFISYYIICTFIFPVDPIRVLWNTRTKCFMSMNDLAQTIVTLGSAPITVEGKEVDFLVAKAHAAIGSQQLLIKSYAEWMGKSATEPTLRGGVYPAQACARLRLTLNEIMSLEEALVAGMTRLHRPRDQLPNVVLRDMMELTRPFLLDAGRLMHQIFQSMIDATERYRTWSMEVPLHLMWKSQLACRSLHHVTGNMQRNFYAAVQQVAEPDKELLNVYVNSSAVEDALTKGVDPSLLLSKGNEELVKRVLAMSFHMSKDSVVSRDDLQAFNAIITVFELLLKTLSELLPPMIEIYEFEKSRHISIKGLM
ncbi:Fusaric acid resistance protein-like [Lotmaria passim]